MSGDLSRFTSPCNDDTHIRIENPLAILLLMLRTLKGLRNIHNRGMAHSDVKPANILYKIPPEIIDDAAYFNDPQNIIDTVVIKFGDPGLACTDPPRAKLASTYSELQDVRTCIPGGTPYYMDPQFYRYFIEGLPVDDLEFFQKNDLWGVGKVFYEMVFDRPEDLPSPEKITSQADIPRFNYSSGFPELDEAINDILKVLLVYDWQRRPSASQLVGLLEDFVVDVLNISGGRMGSTAVSPRARVESAEKAEEKLTEKAQQVTADRSVKIVQAETPLTLESTIKVYDMGDGERFQTSFNPSETGYDFLSRVRPEKDNRIHALYYCPLDTGREELCTLITSKSMTLGENGVQSSGQLVIAEIPRGEEAPTTIDIRPSPVAMNVVKTNSLLSPRPSRRRVSFADTPKTSTAPRRFSLLSADNDATLFY
jgi:serine/threonine protein kinase